MSDQKLVIRQTADLEVEKDVPIKKLRMLITLLCDKYWSFNDIPQHSEMICPTITMQTKQFSRPSRNARQNLDNAVQRRFPRGSDKPTTRYLTLKAYSTIRSRISLLLSQKTG